MTPQKRYDYRSNHIEHTCHELGITRRDYKLFVYSANKLHHIFENQYNGYPDLQGNWDNEAEKRDLIKEEKITNRIEVLAKEHGLYYFIQSDPRGASLYLDNKPIIYNSYTNAYSIY